METILGTIGAIFGSGILISLAAIALKKIASQKNARSLAKSVAPVIDSLVVKIAGGEKNAEKLEKMYVPFLQEFMDELIIQLKLDNENARSAVKEAAGS